MTFIGRETELQEIRDIILDDECRLLSVVGPGGCGKTRLATEIGYQVDDHFQDGVPFISLQSLNNPDMLAMTILDSFNISFSGMETPENQLFRYLRNRNMLLILDNLDHLLSAADLLTDILARAPSVKLMVTSREVLNLRDEWLFPIDGLAYPTLEDHHPEDFDAVQLFASHARRVRREFELDEQLGNVVQICQLVQGMPLAIELAASWTKSLSCVDILREIQQNIDFLETNLRDFPERHRSIRAVFDQSWEHLTPKERDIFKRLSVFQSGFQREAAEAIAGASVMILTSLVDKSLLRRETDGRFQMHELLRQYAQDRLNANPEESKTVVLNHHDYYAKFLADRYQDVLGGRQKAASEEIMAEIGNIRRAWQDVLQYTGEVRLREALCALNDTFHFRGRYAEGRDLLELAERDTDFDSVRADVLAYLGWMAIRLGDHRVARLQFMESRDVLQSGNISILPGNGTDPDLGIALVAVIVGNFEEAVQLAEQAVENCRVRRDNHNLTLAYYVLSSAAQAQGRYDLAFYYAQQASNVAKQVENQWFLAYCLIEQGNIARAQGDYISARQYFQESYEIREAFGDPEGMALSLSHLGRVALLREEYTQAIERFEVSIRLYQTIGDVGGLMTALEGLGAAYTGTGRMEEARTCFLDALQIPIIPPRTLSALASVGEFFIATGYQEAGQQLLTMVDTHPLSEHETKARAHLSLAGLRQQTLAPADETIADLEAVVEDVHEILQKMRIDPARVLIKSKESIANQTQEILIEPLSDRELEVLSLLADGMTNQQIAEELVVAIGTVKAHNHNIFSKLGVRNRVRAIMRARELGILN